MGRTFDIPALDLTLGHSKLGIEFFIASPKFVSPKGPRIRSSLMLKFSESNATGCQNLVVKLMLTLVDNLDL